MWKTHKCASESSKSVLVITCLQASAGPVELLDVYISKCLFCTSCCSRAHKFHTSCNSSKLNSKISDQPVYLANLIISISNPEKFQRIIIIIFFFLDKFFFLPSDSSNYFQSDSPALVDWSIKEKNSFKCKTCLCGFSNDFKYVRIIRLLSLDARKHPAAELRRNGERERYTLERERSEREMRERARTHPILHRVRQAVSRLSIFALGNVGFCVRSVTSQGFSTR